MKKFVNDAALGVCGFVAEFLVGASEVLERVRNNRKGGWMAGTVALSWGRYGGFYAQRHRVCFGWAALTLTPPVEIDDLMRGYADARNPVVDWEQVADHRGRQIERMRWTLQEIAEPDWWENALSPQRGAQVARARLEFERSVDRGEVTE